MARTFDDLVSEFFRFKGMKGTEPITDELAFYGEFTQHNYKHGAGGGMIQPPPNETLYNGYLAVKGISADTPVAPAGEVAFFGEFALWVHDKGYADYQEYLKTAPRGPVSLMADPQQGVAIPRFGFGRGGGGAPQGGGMVAPGGNVALPLKSRIFGR